MLLTDAEACGSRDWHSLHLNHKVKHKCDTCGDNTILLDNGSGELIFPTFCVLLRQTNQKDALTLF